MKFFESSIYRPNPEKPGYLKFERMATVGELFDFCKASLDEAGVSELLEYFSIMSRVERDQPLPVNLRWLVVFPVTGGNEGFYIHIEAIYHDDSPTEAKRKLLILGKDLSNKMDTALKAVNVLAPLLS
jgi:hypothetical protein